MSHGFLSIMAWGVGSVQSATPDYKLTTRSLLLEQGLSDTPFAQLPDGAVDRQLLDQGQERRIGTSFFTWGVAHAAERMCCSRYRLGTLALE